MPNESERRALMVEHAVVIAGGGPTGLMLAGELALARVIRQVPESKLSMECKLGANSPEILGKVIEHYLVHLKHHLQQMHERKGGMTRA